MFGSEHRKWKSFFSEWIQVLCCSRKLIFFLNKIIFDRNWPNYKTKNKSCLTQMENSQIPRYLFGLSTTFPPLSLFTPRNQDLVFCCQKEFPRAGARPLHPSSSFTVLQCYTRGNPFKAGPGRAETKKAEKKRRKMWFCSNKLGGQPPRWVWRPWLSRPTNPQVESVSPVERLLEQRPNCAHLGFRGLEGICCLLPTCGFHPFPPRPVLTSGIEKNLQYLLWRHRLTGHWPLLLANILLQRWMGGCLARQEAWMMVCLVTTTICTMTLFGHYQYSQGCLRQYLGRK